MMQCSETNISDDAIGVGENYSYVADTTFSITIFMESSSSVKCNVTHHFQEYSLHYFNFSEKEELNCSFMTLDNGQDASLRT